MNSSRSLRALAASVVLAGAGAGAFPRVAHAAEMGGLAVRPATYDPNDPATRAYFKPVLTPGSTYSGAVIVGNTSAQPMKVYAYPVDGLTGQTGGAVYANQSDPRSKAGAWVTVAQSSLTLPPDSETPVAFQVSVPANASAGDHLAGVAVEQAVEASSHPAGSSFSVREVIRDVVGVSIKVPGPAAFTVTAGSPRLQALAGTGYAEVKVPLTNTGGALGKPRLTVTVTGGPNGYSRTVARQLDTVLPGDSIDYPFIWPDDLPPGSYRVSVVVSGTDGPASAARADSQLGSTLNGASAPGANKLVTVVRVGGGMAKGTMLALLAGLGLLLATGWGTVRAVTRRARPVGA